MDLQQALTLVREKYQEEQEGSTNIESEKAEQYEQAFTDYPVMMSAALHIFAKELSKDMP